MKNIRPGKFFTFYSKEHSGAIVLLCIAVAIALIPAAIATFRKPVTLEFTQDSAFIAQLLENNKNYKDSVSQSRFKKRNFHIQDESQLRRMGFDKSRSKYLMEQYRKGNIRTFGELAKAGGRDSLELTNDFQKRQFPGKSKTIYTAQNPLELNGADSTQLVMLSGIGSKTAERILKYRNKLGGFYSNLQLLEIYYVDTLVMKSLLPVVTTNPGLIRKIPLQEEFRSVLELHPYLSRKQVGALLAFCRQHGGMTQSEFLTQPYLTKADKERIQYYIELKRYKEYCGINTSKCLIHLNRSLYIAFKSIN
jgi:DNA uptake protein ComE-like DNA-binding protein